MKTIISALKTLIIVGVGLFGAFGCSTSKDSRDALDIRASSSSDTSHIAKRQERILAEVQRMKNAKPAISDEDAVREAERLLPPESTPASSYSDSREKNAREKLNKELDTLKKNGEI